MIHFKVRSPFKTQNFYSIFEDIYENYIYK